VLRKLRIHKRRFARLTVALTDTVELAETEIATENATLNETSPANTLPAGVPISTSKIR
jgi:hypothetical protein